jgi:hypothetical protein
MRWLFALLIVVVNAVPAAAAGGSNFAGLYDVSLAPKPGLDGPTCPSYDVKSLNVEKGQIQSSSAQPLLSGSLNDKGVLDGHMRMADGSDVPFQGRVHSYEYDPLHIHIDATIVDAKSGCGWTLGLVHE